jgi:hypothetical protein
VWPEDSDAGAADCWPGVLYVNASNPPPLEVGLSVGDIVTVAFSKDTDKLGVDAQHIVAFEPAIGEFATEWLSDRLMVVRVVSSAAVVDLDAVDVGVLRATLLASANVRAKYGSSSLPNTTVLVGGTWGEPSPPRFLRIVVNDTGRQSGVGVGDRTRIVFDQRVSQLPLTTRDDVDRVLQFTPPLSSFGLSYVGSWWNASALDVVVTSGRVENASELRVGRLVVRTLPSGRLTSVNGQSGASDDNATVVEGAWGDAPVAVLQGKTSRSLRASLSPPQLRFGYAVTRYVVQWSTVSVVAHAASWEELTSLPVHRRYNASLSSEYGAGAAMEVVVRNVTAGVSGVAVLTLTSSRLESAVFDIDDLTSGVEYFVHVACNNLGALSPFDASTPPSKSPDMPVIHRIDVATRVLNGAGGDVVRVTGERLGDPSVEVVLLVLRNANYTFRSQPCVALVVFVELQCLSPPGAGWGFSVAVEVDGVLSGWHSSTVSYAAPTLYSFDGAVTASSNGGEEVVLYGRNFGPASLSPTPLESVVYAPVGLPHRFEAANCAITLNHTEITCRTVPGVGGRLLWTVTVAGQSSSNQRTHYAVPVITDIRVAGAVDAGNATTPTLLLRTEGGQAMVISGQHFGTASPSFVSAVEARTAAGDRVLRAVDCLVTVDHVEVRCVTPPGVGTGYRWTLVVAEQRSAPHPVPMSYLPPVVTFVGVDGGRLAPTAGGGLLSIVGANLGNDLSAVAITWNGTPLPSVFFERDFHELRVRTPAGEGADVTVALWVGGQAAALPSDSQLLAFRPPTVLAVDLPPSPRLVDCGDIGSNGIGGGGASTTEITLVLTGGNFGAGVNTSVRVGAGVCTLDAGQSGHDRIVCTTLQCVGDVVVTASGKASAPVPYDHIALSQAPRISSVFPGSGPTVGGTELRVTGSFFRLSGTVALVEIDAAGVRTNVSLPCNVTSYGPTEIRCVSPRGDGARFDVVVFTGGLSSPPYRPLWRYASPVVLSTDRRELPTHPDGIVLSVTGRNFGWRGLTHGSVTIGSRPCVVVTWSDTEVTCRPPIGTSSSAAVEVVATGIPSTDVTTPPSVFIRYSAPVVLHASSTTWSTTGGVPLTITGRDFGAPLPVTVWLHRSVLPNDATLLPGVRGMLTCPVNASSSNATTIQCTMPPGYGSDWVVTVINHADAADSLARHGAQLAANATVRVGYVAPTVTSATVVVVRSSDGVAVDAIGAGGQQQGAAPAVGGFLIRVRGANLSTRPVVLVSGDACSLVGDVAPTHDSVVCTAPPHRINADAVVTVLSGGLVSNAARFSYDRPVVTSAQPALITAMAHTQRATVRVAGLNFGVVLPLVVSSHRVTIGDRPCLAVLWLSDAELTCLFAEDLPVGWHNVTVWVRDGESHSSSARVRAECPPSFYGADGETCKPCPEGGSCDGGMSDPVAVSGFFRLSRAVFTPCQPREACLGGVNSTCHRNYGGDRCADCAVGTYRCVCCFCVFVRLCVPSCLRVLVRSCRCLRACQCS